MRFSSHGGSRLTPLRLVKSWFNFHMWQQSHYVPGVMTQSAGTDISCRCLMETKRINGSHNTEKHFSLFSPKTDSPMWAAAASETQQSHPCWKWLLQHFHIYPLNIIISTLLFVCCQIVTCPYLFALILPCNPHLIRGSIIFTRT